MSTLGAVLTVGLFAAADALTSTLRQMHLQLREAGSRDQLLDAVGEDAVVRIAASVETVTGVTAPWVLATSICAALLIVIAVRFVAGHESGRRHSRALLVAITLCALIGATHASVVLLTEPSAWAEGMREAAGAISRGWALFEGNGREFGEPELRRWISAGTLAWCLWVPAVTIVAGSVLLHAAAGRERVRAWCEARSRPVAPEAPTE